MLSAFDVIKIGIGPSSSHTVGPWIAARHFLKLWFEKIQNIESIHIFLYGSLAKTGLGHGTDIAILMGLMGEDYKTINPEDIHIYVKKIKEEKKITLDGDHSINFYYQSHFHFEMHLSLDFHPNGMKLIAYFKDGSAIEKTYFSIGGGFVVDENGKDIEKIDTLDEKAKFPYHSAQDILVYCETLNKSIPEFIFLNEESWRTGEEIHKHAMFLWSEMQESMWRGLNKEGFLPGSLKVNRRASALSRKLLDDACFKSLDAMVECIRKGPQDFNTVNKWISIFALAVNEENAAIGRIVTAPTNGSAGVIPAVMMYARCFLPHFTEQDVTDFLLTAGAIGVLYKTNATISAAMGGCQAEIGVSSSMSAGALVQILGGSKEQVMKAAEIAMEHHLGMTCDPIGGLVQIPCIERNIMGAVKAITAANVTIEESVEHQKISLDHIIETLWNTALDMSKKYKETSEGGLAIIPLNLTEC